ncbi:hypothetical protein MauCBS54593_004491 [Microsporum audouinii]
MNSTLAACPLDIVERIVAYLGLEDIRNLRRTSKAVSIKSSQGRFRRACRMKQLDLTAELLQAFTKTIESRSNQLRHLCLVGLARKPNLHGDAGEAGKRQGRLADHLAELFNEIAKHNDNNHLELLTLRVINVYKDGSRHLPSEGGNQMEMPCRIWFCAVYMWQVVLQALATSHLRIEKLNLFNDETMKHCSLPCDRLYAVELQDPKVAESFSALKSLSLSLCSRVFNIYKDMAEPDESYLCAAPAWKESIQRDYNAEANDEVNFIGVAKLIGFCSQLEDFELHFFHISNKFINSLDFQTERILQYVVEMENLPRLKRVMLRGIGAREADLLEFIKRTEPSDLSLENIRLAEGHFASIINYCTSNQPRLHSLRFESLYEQECNGDLTMVLFPWHEGARTEMADMTLFTGRAENWERKGDGIRQPIPFIVDRPRILGCPANVIHHRWRETEYGAW